MTMYMSVHHKTKIKKKCINAININNVYKGLINRLIKVSHETLFAMKNLQYLKWLQAFPEGLVCTGLQHRVQRWEKG